MTIQPPFSFYNIIGFIFATITLSVVTSLVIYLLKRMWRKKKSKLIWTPISSVDRRSNLSYEEFVREYASVGKPVIITDAMKDWKASTKWTMDFFRSEYVSAVGQVLDCAATNTTTVPMTIGDYLDYMSSSKRDKLLTLERLEIFDYPELQKDYKIPVYFPNIYDSLPEKLQKKYRLGNGGYSKVLIGRKNTSNGLHYDTNHDNAWVGVISGQKRVILFSPDQQDFLYDGDVDSFNPDFEKYPLYANTNPVECILNQGEIIYIPPDWWHHLKNIEDTITVAHNTVNEYNLELSIQCFAKKNPILGFVIPLILEFPWLGRVLVATDLI